MFKDKKFNIYFITTSIIIFTISVIRSLKTGITFDEALTYLNFVLTPEADNVDFMANNHLLNTYLIKFLTFLTGIKYNEFLIRIPSLIFYIVYIIYTYRLSHLYKNKYFISSLLLFNYVINEFASLARGYMMASSIVLMGIYYYKKWLLEKKNNDLKKALFLLLISGLANTITLIIFGSFTLDATIRILKEKKFFDFLKKNKGFIIIITLITILLLGYHLYIYNNDNYISYCNSNFFECLIYIPLNYYGIGIDSKLIICFIFILTSFSYFNINNFNQNNSLYYVAIIFFFFFIICKLILPINYPNGRSLIPFYSIYTISIIEFFENFNQSKIINLFVFLLTIFCALCFFKNININYVREWKDNSEIKNLAKKMHIKNKPIKINSVKSSQTTVAFFYNEKYHLGKEKNR